MGAKSTGKKGKGRGRGKGKKGKGKKNKAQRGGEKVLPRGLSAGGGAHGVVTRASTIKDLETLRQMKELFTALDEDNSGTLDRREMAAIVPMLNLSLSPEEEDKAWAQMDRDGGGDVDFAEFSGWMISHLAALAQGEHRPMAEERRRGAKQEARHAMGFLLRLARAFEEHARVQVCRLTLPPRISPALRSAALPSRPRSEVC
eukprot:COSAG01_NODE_1410_length_10411_cov_7.944337_4_plen_202_part_00